MHVNHICMSTGKQIQHCSDKKYFNKKHTQKKHLHINKIFQCINIKNRKCGDVPNKKQNYTWD